METVTPANDDEDEIVRADEFDCDLCGRHIFSLPPHTLLGKPPPTRCAACQWIEEFVADPAEREELRKRLGGLGLG